MVLNNIRAWPRPLLGFCEKLTLSWLKLGQWLKSDEKDLTIYGFLWHVLCWCFLSIVASQGEVDNCWRSVDFNAGHSPSPLGWNPGHCYLANLCHVCERVILHNLQLKNMLVYIFLTRIPCLSVFFLCRHILCANHSFNLCACTSQIGFFFKFFH